MTSTFHSMREPFLESVEIELGFEGRPGFSEEWVGIPVGFNGTATVMELEVRKIC